MKFNKTQIDRLDRVAQAANADRKFSVDLLYKNQGDREGCLNVLASKYGSKAIIEYFKNKDLKSFKYYSCLSSRLHRMEIDVAPETFPHILMTFYALMCDDSEVFDWFRQCAVAYNTRFLQDRNNPKDFYCHPFHIILAMNGEWKELAPRCESVIASSPAGERKYLVDHRFMLALAQGNEQGMIDALAELTSPKVAKIRNKEHVTHNTELFVSVFACIFMKLAYVHGYQLDFENKWIPKDWIPVEPLANYPIPEDWVFMQQFDYWKSFDGEFARYSPTPKGKVIIDERLYT